MSSGDRHAWGLIPCLGVPLALGYLYLTSWSDSDYLVTPLALAGAVAVAVVGLDVLFGIARQLNLGHAFFFGASAYASTILAGPDHEWPPVLAIVVSVIGVTLLAYPIGWVLLRLEGFFFAAATLGLAIIGQDLLLQLRDLTGGADGLAVPTFAIGGVEFNTPLRVLLLTWVPAILVAVLAKNFSRSGHGLAAHSIGEDETAAAAQGIDVFGTKVHLFLFASCLAALGGSLYAFAAGFVYPGTASLVASLELVVVVVLGRAGSIVGPIVAVVFLRLLPAIFEPLEGRLDLVYGLTLIVLLLLVPDELRLDRVWDRVSSRRTRSRRTARSVEEG